MRFRNGKEILFEVEQLVALTNGSDRDGLNVTDTLFKRDIRVPEGILYHIA